MRHKKRELSRPLCISVWALLLARPVCSSTRSRRLPAVACLVRDADTEQSAERLIFTGNPGQITLYEQIHYTGSPKDFAWVLPVPAVPKVDTASLSLFQVLDQETAPRIYQADAPSCPGSQTTSAPAPSNTGAVNVYSSGAIGPYSYNVIGSAIPRRSSRLLTGHKDKIPADLWAEMQPRSLPDVLSAMRLQDKASTQDMLPVKITYPTSQSVITIPLRMATPMGKANLDVLVWIFAHSRYVPQNYQSLQLNDNQLNSGIYSPSADHKLVSQAVSKVGGHGFVTEDAEPTSDLFMNNTEQTLLKSSYRDLTRLYTSIAPTQINLDPSFVAQTGLPDVNRDHEVANAASSQPSSRPLSPGDRCYRGWHRWRRGADHRPLCILVFGDQKEEHQSKVKPIHI